MTYKGSNENPRPKGERPKPSARYRTRPDPYPCKEKDSLITEMLSVLKEVEWRGYMRSCPECTGEKKDRNIPAPKSVMMIDPNWIHDSDCKLAAVIAKAEEVLGAVPQTSQNAGSS